MYGAFWPVAYVDHQLLIGDGAGPPVSEAARVHVCTANGCGRAQRYSEHNWGRRWMVEGVGSGWWLELGR
jgi:hypothetical protein